LHRFKLNDILPSASKYDPSVLDQIIPIDKIRLINNHRAINLLKMEKRAIHKNYYYTLPRPLTKINHFDFKSE